ncbi:hypothetical protein Save01_09213 [Streptomyces avermitilis]
MCWTVWGVPLMTREVGVLMAAMARSFSWAVRWWVMWWGVVWRVVMVPGGMVCMRVARWVMRVVASVRVRMPARWAAVISPRECPA